MKESIITFFIVVTALCAMLQCTHIALAEPSVTIPEDVIIFRSDFSDSSAAGFIHKVMLHEGKYLPIYIDSPGGSVFALDHMISAVKATGKKTVCFVNFAASAAFILMNSVCDVRVVQPNSVLMSHQAAVGYRGEVNRIESFKKLIDSVLLRLDNLVSKRLKISTAELREKSRDEWWVTGAESRKHNLADKVVNLRCTPAMTKAQYSEKIQVFVYTFDLTWSNCPLLPYPTAVNGEPTFAKPVPVSLSSRERFEAHKQFYLNFGVE